MAELSIVNAPPHTKSKNKYLAQFSFLNFFCCLRQGFWSCFALPKSSLLPKIHYSVIKQKIYQKKPQISSLAKASLNIRNLKILIATVNGRNKNSEEFLFLCILIYKSIHSSLIQSI